MEEDSRRLKLERSGMGEEERERELKSTPFNSD